MKLKVITILLLAFGASNAYSTPLLDNSQSILLTLKDKNSARVTTCEDFIALRRSGETVVDYPGLSDPDARDAKAALINCYINTYAASHKLVEITPVPTSPTSAEVVAHFPASAALVISNEDEAKLNKQPKGKTILQKVPDLKPDGNGRMVSSIKSEGYMVLGRQVFKDNSGQIYPFITVSAFTLGGTYAVATTYKVMSEKTEIWDVEKITENSPL